MKHALAIAATAMVFALAGCSSKGKTREPADLQSIDNVKVKASVVWKRSLGDSNGLRGGFEIDVQDDAVFAADADGDVYALETETGKTIWQAETGERVISGPASSGNLVLVGTRDAEVIALSRADGSEVWRSQLSSEVLASPAGDGDTVIARTVDGRVFALSAADGTRLWTFDRTVPSLTLRGLSRPVMVGPAVLVGLDGGRLVALRVDTGEVLWEQVVASPTGRSELERLVDVDADPIAVGGGVFALSYGGELVLIDPRSGDSRWDRSIRSYTGGTVFGTRGLAVSDADGVVWALDAESGAAVWKQEELQYRMLSQPAAIGDYIAVADYKGYIHFLSPGDGRIVGRTHALSDPVQAAPVVVNDRLYMLDIDGHLVVLELKEAG